MLSALLRFRRPLIVMAHLFLVALANYLAFWLRFDGAIPDWAMGLRANTALLAVIRMLIFVPFRLYQGMWQYTSVWDFKNIIASSILGIAVFYCAVQWGLGLELYPRSIYVVDTVLLIGLMGAIRLSRRLYRDTTQRHASETRVLVYGAGDAGESLVRALKHGPANGFKPVGFLDDDPGKTGLRIHGMRVLGGRQDLSRIVAEVAPHVVLLAMPSAKPRVMRDLVKLLESHKVRIQTVPDLHSILEGHVEITRIRNLAVEDLLERAPVGLEVTPLRRLIKGKSIMVTGAGGSIGSELCRQIAALEPSCLTLFERYENSLFAIHRADRSFARDPDFPIVGMWEMSPCGRSKSFNLPSSSMRLTKRAADGGSLRQ
jgi:FlaA1/EpsC-like NDP-sugar epimerase